MHSTDVVIIGAGPAGIAAAITASRRGRKVIVVDKATFPRDKFCGDGLTTECLRLLERLGLEPTRVTDWNAVTDVVVRAPSGKTYELPLPQDGGQFAAVVPRLHLDNALVELARSLGIEIVEGAALTSVNNLDDRVQITLDGLQNNQTHIEARCDIEARYLIAADGMWSPTRKLLGINPQGYRGEWHAFRQYFSNVGPKAQHLVVWFEPDLLPGYAWSFPLPGQRANVGFGIHRGGKLKTRDMKHLWPDLLSRPHVAEVLGPDAAPEASHRAWPIPARIGQTPLDHGRVLFVGDAAAAADPMTGEGIAQALLTGILAADALSDAGPYQPSKAASKYRTQIHHHLARDHRMANQLSWILGSRRGTNLALQAAGATDWTKRNFARWMFEDYPRALIATPKRWHRRMFTGPGAYKRALDRPHDRTAVMAGHEPLTPGPDEPVHGGHGS